MRLNLLFPLIKTLLFGLLSSYLLNYNIFWIIWVNIISFYLLSWNLLILKLMLWDIWYGWYFYLIFMGLLLNNQIYIRFLGLWGRRVGRIRRISWFFLITLWRGGCFLWFFLFVWILLMCLLLLGLSGLLLILIFHFRWGLFRPRILHLLRYIAILSWKIGFIGSWHWWLLRLVFIGI